MGWLPLFTTLHPHGPNSYLRLGVEVCVAASRNHMMTTLFDILKKDRKGTFHWIEAVTDIDTAEARLRQLSAESSDDFVVFREMDLRVVATYSDKQYRRV
jgi:hypothetical protein